MSRSSLRHSARLPNETFDHELQYMYPRIKVIEPIMFLCMILIYTFVNINLKVLILDFVSSDIANWISKIKQPHTDGRNTVHDCVHTARAQIEWKQSNNVSYHLILCCEFTQLLIFIPRPYIFRQFGSGSQWTKTDTAHGAVRESPIFHHVIAGKRRGVSNGFWRSSVIEMPQIHRFL